MNFAILKGHIGQEPNIRTLDNGRKVATFTLATTGRYKAQDGSWKEEPPVWHNIVAWGHLADQPVQKGNLVEIKGKITNRTYEDKEGVKRYTTEIVATDLDIIKVMRRVDSAALPTTLDDPKFRYNEKQPDNDPLPTTVDPTFFNSDIAAGSSQGQVPF